MKKELRKKFNLNWDLTVQGTAKLTYLYRECFSNDRFINCVRIPGQYEYSGLRVYNPTLGTNHFSTHAVEIYDNMIKNSLVGSSESFMRKHSDLFECHIFSNTPVDCLDIRNGKYDIYWVPKGSRDDLLVLAATEMNVALEFVEFGTTNVLSPRLGPCIRENIDNFCSDYTSKWNGVLKVKDNYPPTMKSLIDNYISGLDSSISELDKKLANYESTEEDVNIDYQTAIFAIGSANEFVDQIIAYESVIQDAIDKERQQQEAMVQMIISMVVTEVVVTVITAGIGSVIVPALASGINALRYSSAILKLTNVAERIPPLTRLIKNSQGVKSLSKIIDILADAFKGASKVTQKAGAKIRQVSTEIKQCVKCYGSDIMEIGVDTVVSSVLPLSRRDLRSLNSTLVYLDKRVSTTFPECLLFDEVGKGHDILDRTIEYPNGNFVSYESICQAKGIKLDENLVSSPRGEGVGTVCEHIIEQQQFKK